MHPSGTAIEDSLRIVPKLADAPDSFDSILSELSVLRATLEDRLLVEQDTIAQIDLLAEALTRSSADAAALIRRLSVIAQTADQYGPGDGVRISV